MLSIHVFVLYVNLFVCLFVCLFYVVFQIDRESESALLFSFWNVHIVKLKIPHNESSVVHSNRPANFSPANELDASYYEVMTNVAY